MIGVVLLQRGFKAAATHLLEERTGITNRTESCDTRGRRQRLGTILERRHARRTHFGMKNRTLAGELANLRTKIVEFTNLIAPCDHQAISPAETIGSFTKSSVRKQVAAAPWVSCINRHDVQVTRETQMLKTIV